VSDAINTRVGSDIQASILQDIHQLRSDLGCTGVVPEFVLGDRQGRLREDNGGDIAECCVHAYSPLWRSLGNVPEFTALVCPTIVLRLVLYRYSLMHYSVVRMMAL